ncbi:MAG: helix-turn-helix transcriptional regulator [Lentisphaeria bacterium]|nr:helix-turn-helix transcriptional regulator [Lentisphaeria bacterium]
MKLKIVHSGLYSRPETYVQELVFTHIGLVVGGLDYMNIRTPDGGGTLRLEPAGLPCLSFIPTGATIDFRFNRKRENWVIQCRIPELRAIPHECSSVLEYDGSELCVPYVRPLTVEQAFAFRERFSRIGELHRSGTPANTAAAEWMAAGITGEMLAAPPDGRQHAPSPAARLRGLIDADTGFRQTLGELSRDAGASAGHLRRLFREEFRIDPGEYRARRRLGRIMELIDRNDRSLKEIAEEVGMRHVTHLHAFVRERCGATPGELQKQRGRLRSAPR